MIEIFRSCKIKGMTPELWSPFVLISLTISISRAIFRLPSDEDLSSVDDERMAGHHAGVVGAEKNQRPD